MSPDFLTQLILQTYFMFPQQYGGKGGFFCEVNATLQIKHPSAWWLGKWSEAVGLDNYCKSLPTSLQILSPPLPSSLLSSFLFLLPPHCRFHVWGSNCIAWLRSSVLPILHCNYFNKILDIQAQKVQISIHLLNYCSWPFKVPEDSLIKFSYPLISMGSCFILYFTKQSILLIFTMVGKAPMLSNYRLKSTI